MFFKGSRYADVAEHQITGPRGRVVRYKKIRLIPDTPAETVHEVQEGERLDLIAYQHEHEPDGFWRICDANRAMWPDELVAEPGRRILIPTPET